LTYANLKENFMKNNQFLRSERQVTEIIAICNGILNGLKYQEMTAKASL